MKRILLLLITMVTLSVQAQKHVYKPKPVTNQQRAEKLVTDYLLTHLNDPHSYESVGFTHLDSVFYELSDDEYYVMATKRLQDIPRKISWFEQMIQTLAGNTEIVKMYKDSIQKAKSDTATFANYIWFAEKAYKREQTGWRMLHTYRAKNLYGGLILETDTVNISVDLTEIQSMKKVDDSN